MVVETWNLLVVVLLSQGIRKQGHWLRVRVEGEVGSLRREEEIRNHCLGEWESKWGRKVK